MQQREKIMKNKKRTVLTVVIAVLAIALIATSIMLLKKDKMGYNYFERNQTIASVGNLRITKGEFAQSFNDYYSNISTYNLYALYYGYGQYFDTSTEEGLNDLREYIMENLLAQKAYVQMAEEMGITLTEEEEALCKQDGKDAYDELYNQCVESAKSAGSTTPETYADTTIASYLSGMGLTKSSFIARQTEASRAEMLAELVYTQLQEEKVVADEDLPQIYADYVQEHYVDAYEDGAYASYEYYRQMGQYNTPYLYVPEDFVFIRVIQLNALDLAQESMEKIENDPAQFEILLKDEEVNLDAFIGTLEEDEGYGIGALDSLFDNAVYMVANELEVGEVEMVTVENSTTDSEGNSTITPIYYIIKRIEGEPAGVIPYEKVADKLHDNLVSIVKTTYAEEALDSWMENAGVVRDEAAIAAVKPIS